MCVTRKDGSDNETPEFGYTKGGAGVHVHTHIHRSFVTLVF